MTRQRSIARVSTRRPRGVACLGAACLGLTLGGCHGDVADAASAIPPDVSALGVTVYPASGPGSGSTAATQDLLTAGLGKDGLAGATPTYADPLAPTALELRRNAIHASYRGSVDIAAAGGYGSLYGPNVDVSGTATSGQGLIPGREYLATLDDATGRKRVAIVVQVPDSFDRARPCIVLGPSSGSLGVYGAIASASEWGLKHACAVALTDAGKGIGLYDPADDSVNKIDGTRATRTAAGTLAHFAAQITDAARATYNAALPNRLALKHAQSQLNPEAQWGSDTLVAAKYALHVLNAQYASAATPLPFTTANTLVIAGSVSNGGTAVLRAAEQDSEGLIDGVVATGPVTQLATTSGYGIRFAGVAVDVYARQLADYTTYGNVYQPCAALAGAAVMVETSDYNVIATPTLIARAQARCTGLAAQGLLSGATLAAQSADALARLRAYGWTRDHDTMHNAHYGFGNGPILSAMTPWAYGRFALDENLCNTSFAAVDANGAPVPVSAAAKAQSYALGNGSANGAPASVVYDNSVGGARGWQFATSPSTGVQDFGLDNALCQRALVTGVDETGAPLGAIATSTRPTAAQSTAVRAGIGQVLLNGNLRSKPTIVVAGRSDAQAPVNNNARAYVAFNRSVEGAASQLAYVEVANAQHFDGFLARSGFDTRFVPLHVYHGRAMDAMLAHLRDKVALPSSQVVRATPRGGNPGQAPSISAAHVPAILATPLSADVIRSTGSTIDVPL
ncbi:MAG: 3-hydroxybutyrate oligomer hydrolase family protein [Burkholderiaceae bacterium]